MEVTHFSYTVETVNDGFGLRKPKRNPKVAEIETARTEEFKEEAREDHRQSEESEESDCDVEDNESINRIA